MTEQFAPNIFPNASEVQEVYEVSVEEGEGFSFSQINFFCFISSGALNPLTAELKNAFL